MSLILKGIDLPNKDEKYTLSIFNNGTAFVVKETWDGAKRGREKLSAEIIGDISAIQIPKDHGRIGDLDKLQNAIKTDIMGGLNYEHFIRNAPVILEVEGEE